MLKITIELWPFGDDTRRVVIAEAEIWNDGTSDDRPKFGNYEGRFWTSGREDRALRVERHKRAHGVWALLGKFLEVRAKPLPNIQGPVGEPGDSGR